MRLGAAHLQTGCGAPQSQELVVALGEPINAEAKGTPNRSQFAHSHAGPRRTCSSRPSFHCCESKLKNEAG
eukprot:2306663-Pyramimonas_sp.AAC.1